MTREERDYQEALRRIKEAEKNKSVELDLGGLEYLSSFPPELANLTSLQSLNLANWLPAQRRLEPAGGTHLAPRAQPRRAHPAQRLEPPG
jgi:hypothetical protein